MRLGRRAAAGRRPSPCATHVAATSPSIQAPRARTPGRPSSIRNPPSRKDAWSVRFPGASEIPFCLTSSRILLTLGDCATGAPLRRPRMRKRAARPASDPVRRSPVSKYRRDHIASAPSGASSVLTSSCRVLMMILVLARLSVSRSTQEAGFRRPAVWCVSFHGRGRAVPGAPTSHPAHPDAPSGPTGPSAVPKCPVRQARR